MLTGIQLPNHTRPLSALEIERLKALKPECIRAYTNTTREQYQQVIDAVGKVLVILRDHRNDRIDPPVWTQDLLQATLTLAFLGLEFWLAPCNEPNHPEGPYSQGHDIEGFKRDYGSLVGEMDRLWPTVPLVSPNLSVRYGDIEWATACRDLFAWHRYIGCNSYWQYDYHLDSEWGLRIKQFRAIFPDKEFVVLEMGDASPNTTAYLKCQRMKAMLRAMRTLGYVKATSIFILGYDETAPQTWEGFVYRPEDLRALRNDGWPKEKLKEMAKRVAGECELPWEIVDRLIEAESGYNPNAVSPVGAEGLLQLMPEFYDDVNRFDPFQNLTAGCVALSRYLSCYHWDYAKALAAYNWGPGNVNQAEEDYGGNWWLGLPEETRRYIKQILFPGR